MPTWMKTETTTRQIPYAPHAAYIYNHDSNSNFHEMTDVWCNPLIPTYHPI